MTAPSWVRRFTDPDIADDIQGQTFSSTSTPLGSRAGSSTYLERTSNNVAETSLTRYPEASTSFGYDSESSRYSSPKRQRDNMHRPRYEGVNHGYVSDTGSSRVLDSGDELESEISERSGRYVQSRHDVTPRAANVYGGGNRNRAPNPRKHSPGPTRNPRHAGTKRDDQWAYIESEGYSDAPPSIHTSASYGDFEGTASTASGSSFIPRGRYANSAPPSTLDKDERHRRKRGTEYSDETHTSGYSTNSMSELSEFTNPYNRDTRDNRYTDDRNNEMSYDRRRSADHYKNHSTPNDLRVPSGHRPQRHSAEDRYNNKRSESKNSLNSDPYNSYNRSDSKHSINTVSDNYNSYKRSESKHSVNELSNNNNNSHKRSESKLSVNESDISIGSKERTRKNGAGDKNNRNAAQDANKSHTSHISHTETSKTQKVPAIGNVTVAVTNNIQYDPNDPFSFIQPIDVPFYIKMRKCLGPIMAVLLLLILAGALGAAIYFASALKETQEKEIDLLRANLAMKIHHTDYAQDIDKLSKTDFKELSSMYCKQMDIFYSESKFKETYRGCEVLSIENRYINFTLFFVEKEATSSQIIGVIKSSADPSDSNNSSQSLAMVDKFTLELDTLKVTMERRMEPETFNKVIQDPTQKPKTVTSAPKADTPDKKKPPNDTDTKTTVAPPTTTKKVVVGKKKIPPKDKPVYEWQPCKNWIGDYFPHPTKCYKFFQCSNGETIERTCSDDLLYHWKELSCVTKYMPDVQCPDASKAPPRPKTTTTAATTTTTTTTTTIKPTTKSPATSLPESKTTNNAVNVTGNLAAVAGKFRERPDYPANPCTGGKTDGELFPHPDNCAKFIQCAAGSPKTLECQPNTVWDPAKTACVFVSQIKLICPDIKPCERKPHGYFPHPFNCQKFIQCINSVEDVRDCPNNLVWNENANSCVYAEDPSACMLDKTVETSTAAS